ncbi:MAG: YhcH/YjgK/YiaL family protein [Thermodesulfobacteriota bacterium]
MVIDGIGRAALYSGLSPWIWRGLELLQHTDLAALPEGRQAIDGELLYLAVHRYRTRPRQEGIWEAHRRYIDLQAVAWGVEAVGWAPLERLQAGEYDPARDFLPLTGDGDFLTLAAGQFLLLFPDDGHMPGLAVAEPVEVKKVVVKIAVP